MSTNDPARPQSSRRAFLATTTVALALPAAAAAQALASPADADLDAELIELGRQFDEARAEIIRLAPSFAAIDDACEAKLRAWEDANPRPCFRDRGPWDKAYLDAMVAIWSEADRDAHPKWAVEARADSLADRIGKAQAQALAGLAIQARQLAEHGLSDEEWAGPLGDLDWDKFMIRAVVEGVCRLAGVPLLDRPRWGGL